MRSEIINCDSCGAAKGAGNRWLMGCIYFHGYALCDWNPSFEETRIVTEINHFCSEACALKYQGRYLRQDKVA